MASRLLSALRRLVMKRKGRRGHVEHHSFSSEDEDENLDPNALRPPLIEKHTHVDRVCRRDRTSTHTSHYSMPASPQKKRRASSVPPSFASRPSEIPSLFDPTSEPVDIKYLLSQLDVPEKEPRKRTAGVRTIAHTHREDISDKRCHRIARSFSGFARQVHTSMSCCALRVVERTRRKYVLVVGRMQLLSTAAKTVRMSACTVRSASSRLMRLILSTASR